MKRIQQDFSPQTFLFSCSNDTDWEEESYNSTSSPFYSNYTTIGGEFNTEAPVSIKRDVDELLQLIIGLPNVMILIPLVLWLIQKLKMNQHKQEGSREEDVYLTEQV